MENSFCYEQKSTTSTDNNADKQNHGYAISIRKYFARAVWDMHSAMMLQCKDWRHNKKFLEYFE